MLQIHHSWKRILVFVKNDSKLKLIFGYTEDEILKRSEFFFVDKTFVQCGGRVHQQIIGFPLEKNVPFPRRLVSLLIETEFVTDLLDKNNEKHLA